MKNACGGERGRRGKARVPWFNHHRLLEPIGHIPPAEAEANCDRHLAEQAAIPA